MIEIDGYSDVERIGRGGLGDVYRARRSSTGATVAIKVLRDVSDQSVAWHRTRRELTALVALAGHANVVQLLEVLDLPEGPALVMEYAPGGSVAELMLRRDEPLSVGEAVLVGKQTAVALTAAHAQGIVHRDVKPQNLLIDAYGQVKLCDFGIAAVARSEEFRVRTSAISMRYASPEDLDEDVDVGPASDVYSLGATLLHIARGAPPTLRERLTPWIPPADAEPQLAALDRIVARCLHPVPSERPSAADVADELERLAWSIDERSRSIGVGDDDPALDEPPRPEVASPDVGRPTTDGVISTRGSEDDTVLDRQPPGHPIDGPRRGRRGRRWSAVIAAIVLPAMVVAVVLGVVLRRDRSVDAVELADRPGGLVDLTRLEWPDGAPGECLAQVADRLDPVSCDTPHDLQRITSLTLDELAGDADVDVDVDAVRDAARAACDAAVTSAIGRPVSETGLEAPFSAPSSQTWRAGDRTVVCFVGAERRRLVGDALAG